MIIILRLTVGFSRVWRKYSSMFRSGNNPAFCLPLELLNLWERYQECFREFYGGRNTGKIPWTLDKKAVICPVLWGTYQSRLCYCCLVLCLPSSHHCSCGLGCSKVVSARPQHTSEPTYSFLLSPGTGEKSLRPCDPESFRDTKPFCLANFLHHKNNRSLCLQPGKP